jgi:hypothetical protein
MEAWQTRRCWGRRWCWKCKTAHPNGAARVLQAPPPPPHPPPQTCYLWTRAAARDPFAHVAPSGGTLPRHLKPQICSIMVTCTATPAALRGQPRAHLLLRWPEFCCKHPGCRLGSSPGMCCSGSAALPRNPVSAGCATVWWPRAWHQPALPTFQHCIRTICSASATPCIYHHRIPAKKLHTMSCSKP